jgi:phosphoribosylamine-glycine ligase
VHRHGIPTEEFRNFTDVKGAKKYVGGLGDQRLVIEADGHAAGKGVVLPNPTVEALAALDDMMVHDVFAKAGSSVAIERYLEGQEISILTFSDGKTWKSLPGGQDHKRIFEGNKGPNTGGMGVYAPLPFITDDIMAEIDEKILRPTFEGMRAEGWLTAALALCPMSLQAVC